MNRAGNVTAELTQNLKYLHLPTVRQCYEEVGVASENGPYRTLSRGNNLKVGASLHGRAFMAWGDQRRPCDHDRVGTGLFR